MAFKPLGIFWDTNTSSLPKNMNPNDCVQRFRTFIKESKPKNDCIEYYFCTNHWIQDLNESIVESLIGNGVHILENQNISESIERFVDHYGFDSIVVIITDDLNLCPSIRSARRKEVTVILIYGNKASNVLVSSANESIHVDHVFGSTQTVTLNITNIPSNHSRKMIRNLFIPICNSFNCKYRSQRRGSVKLEFNNIEDSKMAEIEVKNLELFGNKLIVEKQNNSFSNSSSICSQIPKTEPQNDDNCKSVLIGLFSKTNTNVLEMVRNIVNQWKDKEINEQMIYRVNRERDFVGKDGKATLIVTAVSPEANNRLLSVAKNRFVDRNKKIYWKRLKRSTTDSYERTTNNRNNCAHGISAECEMRSTVLTKSIIIGLYASHDQNLLTLVRNIIRSWNCTDFHPNHVISVVRAKKSNGKNGKSPLIVSTDSEYNNQRLLEYAMNRFVNKKSKLFWKPLELRRFDEEKKPQSKQLSQYFVKALDNIR